MNDKFLSLLGISKRAGVLCPGHDSVKEAISAKKAKLVIFSSDASERLKDEFIGKLGNDEALIISTEYTMADFFNATGNRAAVMCVTENGFAKRLKELFDEKYKEV